MINWVVEGNCAAFYRHSDTGEFRARPSRLICSGCPAFPEKIFRLRRRANQSYTFARPARERGVGHRHERWAGCGGRGGVARRAARKRTAKSCGPDASTLASSWRWLIRWRWWQKSPITRESTKQPLKPLRREGRIDPANLWWLARMLFYFRIRGCGRTERPAFPAPSVSEWPMLLPASDVRHAARSRRRI